MIATISLALASAAVQAPITSAAPRCAAARVPDCLAGSWSGTFVGAEWTFEFTRKGSAWSGRYLSSKGRSWHPLLGLKVSGEAIAFGIEARPAVTYTLKLDPAAETLSGTVDIGGFHTLPFTASRQS